MSKCWWWGRQHRLAQAPFILPVELAEEVLITYPVDTDRLDIYNQFLMPANVMPKRHKVIETTDIMLQMVASGRGVAALPRWLVEEYADKVAVNAVRLGKRGIAKQIFLGVRRNGYDDRLSKRLCRACARVRLECGWWKQSRRNSPIFLSTVLAER